MKLLSLQNNQPIAPLEGPLPNTWNFYLTADLSPIEVADARARLASLGFLLLVEEALPAGPVLLAAKPLSSPGILAVSEPSTEVNWGIPLGIAAAALGAAILWVLGYPPVCAMPLILVLAGGFSLRMKPRARFDVLLEPFTLVRLTWAGAQLRMESTGVIGVDLSSAPEWARVKLGSPPVAPPFSERVRNAVFSIEDEATAARDAAARALAAE